MFSKEKTQELIGRAYGIAVSHGFHEEDRSNAHYLMLVVSEIGEMVEADRKGLYARVPLNREHTPYADCVFHKENIHFVANFVDCIKDRLEDELADVCIRLYDFLGTRGLEPSLPNTEDIMHDEWLEYWGKKTVCEQCYGLTQIVTNINEVTDNDEISSIVGSALLWCYEFAKFHNIDLLWHVERKMDYNETRAKKHGKSY